MIRWGKTQAGKVRWRCNKCTVSGIKSRVDTSTRNTNALFRSWLLGMDSIKSIAKKKHVSKRTLIRRFDVQWTREIHSSFPRLTEEAVIVIDGTTISHDCIALIVYDTVSNQPLGWSFVSQEEYKTWYPLLVGVRGYTRIRAVVSDGQKGLCKAVRELFPNIPHQRCLAHIIRLSLVWLTRNPHTEAGVELRKIVRELSRARTMETSISWRKSFEEWDEKYQIFLREKSVNPLTNRRWYTHRRLRGVRALIIGSINNLFHFIQDERIPNTSNAVEGGINAPLKEFLHRHRGLSTEKKKILVTHFLIARRKKKPTRNVT